MPLTGSFCHCQVLVPGLYLSYLPGKKRFFDVVAQHKEKLEDEQ